MKELVRNRNQIQLAYDAISLLIDVLDCYNISDIFQPFPNEAALIKRATDQAPGQPLFLSSKFDISRTFSLNFILLFIVVLYNILALRFNNCLHYLLFLGIVFLNFDAKDGSFPKKAEYKLRLNPDFTKSTKWIRAKLVVTCALVFDVFLCC